MRGHRFAIVLRVLPACALLASCSSSDRSKAPPVFGGQGAVIRNEPAETPLPAASSSASSAKAGTGPCAAPSPPSDVALLDDFEDDDNKPFKAFQREGWWYAASDSTEGSKLSPQGKFAPERLANGEATKADRFAAHFKADGQKDWGAIWGTTLRWVNEGVRCPFNASAFAGFRFRAKGPGTIIVKLGIPETQPPDAGGTCKTRCYDSHAKIVYLTDHWDDYLVPWDRLQQGGWGTEARFDSARLVSLSFAVSPADLPADFWVDDIQFVTRTEADALAAAEKQKVLEETPAPPPPPTPAPAKAASTKPSKSH